MPELLSVEHLNKAYRSGWGLHDINLELPSGVIAALGGPNGSGKSTLLRCLAGLSRYEGAVRIGGRLVDGDPASREDIGYLAQTVAMPEQATIGEVIDLFAQLRGVDRNTIPLPEGYVREDHQRIEILSGGQRHRVALAVALLGTPSLLLLDEPVANLDEQGRATFWRVLRRLRDERGVTAIVSSPSPSELRGLVDMALYMDDGSLVRQEALRVDAERDQDDGQAYAKETCA